MGSSHDDHHDGGWDSYEPPSRPQPAPMYVFWSEEELARSEVFQRLLNRTLVHKDRQIEELRIEILGML